MFNFKKSKLKQGSLAWENARLLRIGSSEVFDIVRYYAQDEELQNAGIDSTIMREEEPYTSVWALYHKVLNDGLYTHTHLDRELSEYGHALEPYGAFKLNQKRTKKVKRGEVYISDKLICSFDITGESDFSDYERPFDYGAGFIMSDMSFVCEQKTMIKEKSKKRMVPYKYIFQAQYQLMVKKADYFIIQIMVLKEDTPFIRGKICQMGISKRYKYLDENLDISYVYVKNNEHICSLIKVCLERFFEDVKSKKEPKAYISTDSVSNIIHTIRVNNAYNDKAIYEDYDLSLYKRKKDALKTASEEMDAQKQKIIDICKKYNVCSFKSGLLTAHFSKDGKFLLRETGESL